MARAQMPRDDQINVALLWLENNEGDGSEREACLAVRDWIVSLKQERMLRSVAKDAGIPVAMLRRKIAEREAAQKES